MIAYNKSNVVKTSRLSILAQAGSRCACVLRRYLPYSFQVLLLLTVVLASQSRAETPIDQVDAAIGFKASGCARHGFSVALGGATAKGVGVDCNTTQWSDTQQLFTRLKFDQTYQMIVKGGLCSTHINFDVPDGVTLFINGVESTTIDKGTGTKGSGDGTWEIVARKKCPCAAGRAGEAGNSSLPDGGGVNWEFRMGTLSDGRSAENIVIRENVLSSSIFTPAALIYSPPPRATDIEVIRNGDGSLRQLKSRQSLTDIIVINSVEYDLRFYSLDQVGAKADGVYIVTGSPDVTWKIKNPEPANLNRLQISKLQNGVTSINEYIRDTVNNSWALNQNGLRVTSKTTVTDSTTGDRVETSTVKDNNNRIASKVARTYHSFTWGEELIKEVSDPDGVALLTKYSYYEDSGEAGKYRKLKSLTKPDGSWEKYDYDSHGNKILLLRPWKDLPLAVATEENSHVTKTYFTNSDGIKLSVFPRVVDSIEEKIGGVLVHKTTYDRESVTVNGQPAVTVVETSYSSATSGQTSSVTTYDAAAAPLFAEKPAHMISADGRKDTYSYEKGNFLANPNPALSSFTADEDGVTSRATTIHGTSSSPGGIAFKTTKEVTIRDERGHELLQETYIYNGGSYERLGWTSFSYDEEGRLQQTLRHNGRTSSTVWSGNRKQSETDDAGVETAYTYDALDRVLTRTMKGLAADNGFPAQADVVTTYTYDAEGRTTNETVTAGGLSLTTASTFDVTGRGKSVRDSAGLVTTYTYTNGGRTLTVTLPSGATQATDKYLDGKTKSVIGTAVVGRYSDYGVNLDGTQYTQAYLGSGGLASPRWQKTTSDWLGRAIRVEKPAFADGATLVQTSAYNNKGQLQAEAVMVGTTRLQADKLYEYDALGDRARVGSDIDMSGTLTIVSPDHLVETESAYEQSNGAWFRVSSTKTYLTDNDGTATTMSTQRERLTGFPVNVAEQTVEETTVTDVGGNQTRSTTTINRAAKRVTNVTDTPDSTTDAVSISVNGLLQSSTPTTPESATTYTYDALRRSIGVSSPRTGTSAKSYNPATGQLSTESHGSQTITFEYYPATQANAGRIKARVNANGKRVYFNYNTRGEMTQTWGETTYPLEYVFDAYGQKTEMHTFRGGSGWEASVWPTATTGAMDVTRWIYHEPTGLLEKKRDAAAKQVSYAYDPLGRLTTRTWARAAANGSSLSTAYTYHPVTGALSGIDYSDATPDVTFAYNRGGQQNQVTDAAGTHALTTNAAGAPQTEQITGGILDGLQTSVGYDSYLRRDSWQTVRNGAALSAQTYGYDVAGRLQTVTGGGQTATFAYYPNSGLPNTISFTGGTQTARGYDALGRLQTSATTTPALGTVASYTYTYNTLDQRTRTTREDGSYWSYLYNDRGELTSGKKYWADNTVMAGQQMEYAYGTTGNRNFTKSGGDSLGASLRQSTYAANNLNQYEQRTNPGAIDVLGTADPAATVSVNEQATYRRGGYFRAELAVNNSAGPASVQVSVVGVRNNAGANGEDAVTTQGGRIFVPPAAEVYSYDADGNLTSDGRWQYVWDAENRLVTMQALAGVPNADKKRLEFAYDYMGRRVLKRVFNWSSTTSSYQVAATTKFIYDGWNLAAELDGSNALIKNYVWSEDALLLINEAGNSYHVGYDGNENVTSLVKAGDGTVAAAYEYDPFGNTLQATGAYSAANPFRFSGKYAEQETGLIYYGYRYYNPQIGRWISRDPIEEADGINLYGFVGNDAIGKTDVLGLFTDQDIIESNISYSCNCGWIDWNHVAVGSRTKPDRGPNKGAFSAWAIWNKVLNDRDAERSLTKEGYKVSAFQRRNVLVMYLKYGGEYFVRSPLDVAQKKTVALAIFQEVSMKKEGAFPDMSGSSFAGEDLPSNLISFYAAVNNYTRRDIDRICKVQDPDESMVVWKNINRNLPKNRTWEPLDYNKQSCCTNKTISWPTELGNIIPSAKGYYWRDWEAGRDWQPEKKTIWDRR